MIQMRWIVERPTGMRGIIIGDGGQAMEMVLQFRVQVHPDAAKFYSEDKPWGEWQDVKIGTPP